MAALGLLACSATLSAQTLMWNANSESNLGGYIVQYGTQSGNPSTSIDVGNVTSRAITGLTPGTTYYFQVIAYTTTGQQSSPSTQVTYTPPTAPAPPTITSLSPTSGPISGGTLITINGANFAVTDTVRVGGTLATGITLVSATQLRATTPAGTAGARDVVVTNATGSATATGGFTYVASAPTATSVSPTSGPTTGGTVITVTGTNFVSGATLNIGGTAATGVTFVSATQLRGTTPAKTAGAYAVQVVNPNGQSATIANGFTYTASTGVTPSLSMIAPTSGPAAGGTTVMLSGSNFVQGATVSFGGVAATNVVWTSASRMTAVTPAGTAGARDVTVTNPGGQSVTVRGVYTYTGSATQSTSTATFSRYLAEGVETEQMNTQLAIANPQPTDTQATLTFETSTGAQTQMAVDVPARSRRTVDLSTVPELSGASFSTRVEADQELAVDRLITFDGQASAASLEAAVDQPAAAWYFAEGSTVDPMELFYLVQNPGATEAHVQVRYLLPNGAAPIVRTYTVAPGSRATIWVDRESAALASTDVAAEITSVDGTPIVVERSLYLRQQGSAAPRGGDTSAGVTAPATRWFVEGATGQYTTRLLLANPGSVAAAVQATYQRADGRSVTRSYTLMPNSRQTVDVATVHPSLSNTTVGITVEANAPIVVERTKSWGANGTIDDAVSGAGATAGGPRWLLAEGQQGGERQAQTSVVVVNQGAATDVTVTLLFEDAPEVSATFPVAAGARFTVPMAEAFPAADGRKFSVLVEGADATANLIVDRAIFWQAVGSARTAGADGAASRVR